MAKKTIDASKPVTIKKYANRRLYNTSTSSYVTLDYLAQMVKDKVEFTVSDAKTGDDITRQVLTHIIVEEESKGSNNLLPISFLRHLISFYGDSLQTVLPGYLETSMQSFAKNQEGMRDYMNQSLGSMNPFNQMGEVGKQNADAIEKAMNMFSPFYGNNGTQQAESESAPAPEEPQEASSEPSSETKAEVSSDDFDMMKKQLAEMQKLLNQMTPKG